ncbi:MAG: hypothetical protein SGARI_006650 [Bacillariaceae sp.]
MRRGISRDEIFVTTKIWPSHFGRNSTLEAIPTFCAELGLEYIDMVLMHAPGRFFGNPSTECKKSGLSNSECRKETFQALSELRERGLIRNAGVSNFVTPQIKELQEIPGAAPVANNQIQFNPWLTDEWLETAQYCNDNGIAITGYNSLGGSFQHHEAHTIDVLTNMAEKHGKSVAQIMLRWAMQKGTIVIPGTGNPKHMTENLAVYEMELSAGDMQAIDELRNTDEMKKFLSMDSKTWEEVESK